MSYLRTSIIVLICFLSIVLKAQDREKAQHVIQDLCSDEFSGRGYVNKGDSIAAEYIASSFQQLGLLPLGQRYLQSFSLKVNTIPRSNITIDGKQLIAGYDYLVSPACPTITAEAKLFPVSLKMLHSKNAAKKVKTAVKKGYIPVISIYDNKDQIAATAIEEIKKCAKANLIIYLKSQLTWSVAREQSKIAEIWMLESAYDPFSENFNCHIEAKFIEDYTSQNVCGYIPGTKYADSLIILCGHYDHLGMMGDAVFYGANDNASGISMLLDFASYFSKNPQEYSIAFIAFGAEEAGLIGSHHFVLNPPEDVSMQRIKFVFNMDLMGNGEAGATIVNGSVFKDHFNRLVEINAENNYLTEIKPRGKAANSDHYFFTELGIPSFFIYTMGEYTYYHIPNDNADNLKLGPYYDASFKLIRDFILDLNHLN